MASTAGNIYAKKMADFYRTEHNLPVTATDEEILSFAQEDDEKGFEEIQKLVYAEMGAGPKPVVKEETPIRDTLSAVGGALSGVADDVNKTVAERANRGDLISQAVQAPTNIQNTITGGLERAAEAGGGNRTIEGKVLGGLAKASTYLPFGTPTQTVMNAVPLEAPVVALAKPIIKSTGNLARAAVTGAGDLIEAGAKKGVPGMQPFYDLWQGGKNAVKNKRLAEAAVKHANDVADAASLRLAAVSHWVRGTAQDALDFGAVSKNVLDKKTFASAVPLKKASTRLEEKTAGIAAGTTADIAPAIKEIKNDLVSIITENKDASVISTINKYLGEEVTKTATSHKLNPATMALEAVEKTTKSTKYPKTDVAGLLQDRGKLGKAVKASYAAGGRNTPQTRALVRLINVIDDKIDRTPKVTPALKGQITKVRKGWAEWFETYHNETLVKVRNSHPEAFHKTALKDATSFLEVQKAVPEAVPELVRGEKERLLNAMAGGNSHEILRKELGATREKQALYSRLFNEKDLAELDEFANQGENLKIAKARADELVKGVEEAVLRRRKTEKMTGRASDPRGQLEAWKRLAPGAGIGGAGLVGLKVLGVTNPAILAGLAATGLSPAAVSSAYFAGDRAVRGGLVSAIKAYTQHGPKASADVLRIVRPLLISSQGGEAREEAKNNKPDWKGFVASPAKSLDRWLTRADSTGLGQDLPKVSVRGQGYGARIDYGPGGTVPASGPADEATRQKELQVEKMAQQLVLLRDQHRKAGTWTAENEKAFESLLARYTQR